MYFLIITLGFLLAMRGARPASLQRLAEGLQRIWREAADLFITMSFILALWAVAVFFVKTQAGAHEYAILGFGLAAYLLSRYQEKTDVFFLSVVVCVFMISSRQHDLFRGILMAGAVSAGLAIFQSCFLGLRYKLLFSRVPVSMKGWPVLCLLAGGISLVLWSFRSLVF